MGLPLTGFYWFAALVPILFLLIAIMKFGWGVAKAAPISMMLAGIIAVACYRQMPSALVFEAGKGVWNALTILLVIIPAVYIYELTCETKAFGAIRCGIQGLTQHELLQILILGWIFPSFLQGITGFGVAVAVGAPLLISIGVSPIYSIVIVLLCHSWGATFGTLALAWEALVQQSGMSGAEQAKAAAIAALMIWIFNLISVLYCCWMYGKQKALKEALPLVLPLSLVMGGGEFLLAPVNATIACFIPASAALVLAVIISQSKRYHRAWKIEHTRIIKKRAEQTKEKQVMSFHQALLPYYALTLITIVCLLIPPLNRILSLWKIGFNFPETATGFGYVTNAEKMFSPLKPLTYAGTFLALASIISICYYRHRGYLNRDGLSVIWKNTMKKCGSSVIAITSLIIMAKFMGSSGQIYVFANGIVSVFGRFYVIAAPLVGMVGAFITSSNMSSNILLGNFQMTAADFLKINPAVTCALQTTGAVLGTAFTPGCIIMGISTTGFQGKESDILKLVVPLTLGLAVLFGVFSFIFLL